jgi:hypothetical protein
MEKPGSTLFETISHTEALIKNGATSEQVKAARVTADYDTRYGATSGPWTTDMFVEAVYTSLKQPSKTSAQK